MWTAVFKTGTHTDSSGNTRTWTEKELDEIAGNYDPARHEAPVVLGHPRDDTPAWGWVEELKRTGDVLYARLKLIPEFLEMLKKGLFKKRSISLYPDLTLRHIGFLGAVPPAVKGLPDMNFRGGEEPIHFEFEQMDGEITIRGGKEVKGMKNFLEKLKRLIREEFGEEQDSGEKEKALAEKDARKRYQEAEAFCESLLKEGRLTPAMIKSGLPRFLGIVSGMQGNFDFSEGEKTGPGEFLKRFLMALPKAVPMEEHREFREGTPDERRRKLVEDYVDKNTGASYRDAFIALSKDHPELFR